MNDPSPQKSPPPRGGGALVAVATVIVIALAAIGVYTWESLGPVAMDRSGYVALVLGVLGTIALGCGLMALVFFSHRHGYDEEVGGRRGRPDQR